MTQRQTTTCGGAGLTRRASFEHFSCYRLTFNAAAFLDVPVAEICGHAEFGLVRAVQGPGRAGGRRPGDAAFMQRARRAVKMLGGGIRQAGLIAAPALVALEAPWPALRRDHTLARKLADGLAAIDPSLVDADGVQSNAIDRFADWTQRS